LEILRADYKAEQKTSKEFAEDNRRLIKYFDEALKQFNKTKEENKKFEIENQQLRQNNHSIRSQLITRIEELKELKGAISLLKFNYQAQVEKNQKLEKNLREAQNLLKETEMNAAELDSTLQEMEEHDNVVFTEIQKKYTAIIDALKTQLRTSTPLKFDKNAQHNAAIINGLTAGIYFIYFKFEKNECIFVQ